MKQSWLNLIRDHWRHLLAAGVILLVALPALLWTLVLDPRLGTTTIPYGRFRRLLEGGLIRSARVGPTVIEGTAAAVDARGEPVRYRVSRVGMEHDDDLIRLLHEHIPGGEYEADSTPAALQTTVLPGLLFVLLVLAYSWVLIRSGGMGSALAFARGRPRLLEPPGRRVRFEDVAGHDAVVAELREIIEFLRTPEKYRGLGAKIPRGILLVGPPGTGKTLLARAVAGEASVPFFSLSGSDFVELFVGVGAARVRNLFAKARAKAPCVVFVDELDAIGKSRGTGGPGGHDERDQTLNQLLVELDGFGAEGQIIVLAATNRPETLDPALVRPGRFDRRLVLERPDLSDREQILKVHARGIPLEESANLRQVAAMTPGFVGADLANLVNEAALLAARRGGVRVGLRDFEEGCERLIAGPERRQRLLRSQDKIRIAYHEAGHALLARMLPNTDPVRKISIVGRGGGALGYTLYWPEDDRLFQTRSSLENTLSCLLGGTIAEELALGEASDGCGADLLSVTRLARRMVVEFGMSPLLGRLSYPVDAEGNADLRGRFRLGEQTIREIDLEMRRIVKEAETRARRILERHRPALDALASRLVEVETIDLAGLDAILAGVGERETRCPPREPEAPP